MVGRALVQIFKRQTDHEQRVNDTNVWNDIGFSASDAYSGSICAKTFMKRGALIDFQLEKWLKPTQHGYPRITKYWKQLNEIAQNKKSG
jgi:hypothetical protein